jgi:hypothetical protein
MFVFHYYCSLVSWYHNLLCRFIVIPKLPIIFKRLVCRKTQTTLGKMENNMLKWYGNLVCMEDYRWSEIIITSSPEGRQWHGWPEVQWGKGDERIMKYSNLTSWKIMSFIRGG